MHSMGIVKIATTTTKMFTVKKFFKPIFIIFFKINKKDIAKNLSRLQSTKSVFKYWQRS